MKKRLACAVIFFLLLSGVATASAMALIDAKAIREAQEYGRSNAHLAFQEFIHPWQGVLTKTVTAYPEAQAYLYTPYLVIAVDARERTLSGQNVALADSEKALADYNGTLTFSVVLFASGEESFKHAPKVALQQTKSSVQPYRLVWPEGKLPQVSHGGKSYLKANCYVYFADRSVKISESANLSLFTGDGREHSFSFDLTRIK
ncbi:hypothetical protein [Azotosporobacter soli]|uniref:hypothetical protein n=1 Tax=Azotosporobacter soli TaxID=3055040 RepID=UPI0031FE9DBC